MIPVYMATLTLAGKNDEVVNIDSMMKYHKLLGGSRRNIKVIDSGHDIPYKITEELVINYLKYYLNGLYKKEPLPYSNPFSRYNLGLS